MSNPDEYTKGRKSVVDEIKRYLSEEIEISATRLTKLARMQKDCLTHFRRTYPKFKHRLIAIPNIGTRNALSREQHLIGMSVGTAHLFLAVPRNGFAGLYFLFKRKDKHITTAQAKFRTEMIDAGYNFLKILSVEDFQTSVREYLEAQMNEGHVEQVVCRHTGVDPQLIRTKTSKPEVVRTRQLACFFAQILTGKRDTAISFQYFNSHCGGIYGRGVVKSLYNSDTEYRERVDAIMNELMISPKHMKI